MRRSLPCFPDLRAFLAWNQARGALHSITEPVAVSRQMTAVQLAALRAGGPVLRFEAPLQASGQRATMPLISNLFATPERVAAGLGLEPGQIDDFGAFLAALRNPAPVEGVRDALLRWPILRAALASRPRLLRQAPAQEVEAPPDLSLLPVQTPWPGDAGPLITWPVVITRPEGSAAGDLGRYNLGVYRAQVLGPDRLILRWLAHRGGAAHARGWARAGTPMPVAIASARFAASITSCVRLPRALM